MNQNLYNLIDLSLCFDNPIAIFNSLTEAGCKVKLKYVAPLETDLDAGPLKSTVTTGAFCAADGCSRESR